MAHKSLILKLNSRQQNKQVSLGTTQAKLVNSEFTNNSQSVVTYCNSENNKKNIIKLINEEPEVLGFLENEKSNKDSNFFYKNHENFQEKDNIEHIFFLAGDLDSRVDKVYTIGCFDLFHFGHIQLIKRMKTLGKNVIIGVHDSRR